MQYVHLDRRGRGSPEVAAPYYSAGWRGTPSWSQTARAVFGLISPWRGTEGAGRRSEMESTTRRASGHDDEARRRAGEASAQGRGASRSAVEQS
jgi:hypothetical protein